MLDFEEYECYNLPHVTTYPGLPHVSFFEIFCKPMIYIIDKTNYIDKHKTLVVDLLIKNYPEL